MTTHPKSISPEAMKAAAEIDAECVEYVRWTRYSEIKPEQRIAEIIDTQCNLAKYRAVVEAAKQTIASHYTFLRCVGCDTCQPLRLALSDLEEEG